MESRDPRRPGRVGERGEHVGDRVLFDDHAEVKRPLHELRPFDLGHVTMRLSRLLAVEVRRRTGHLHHRVGPAGRLAGVAELLGRVEGDADRGQAAAAAGIAIAAVVGVIIGVASAALGLGPFEHRFAVAAEQADLRDLPNHRVANALGVLIGRGDRIEQRPQEPDVLLRVPHLLARDRASAVLADRAVPRDGLFGDDDLLIEGRRLVLVLLADDRLQPQPEVLDRVLVLLFVGPAIRRLFQRRAVAGLHVPGDHAGPVHRRQLADPNVPLDLQVHLLELLHAGLQANLVAVVRHPDAAFDAILRRDDLVPPLLEVGDHARLRHRVAGEGERDRQEQQYPELVLQDGGELVHRRVLRGK